MGVGMVPGAEYERVFAFSYSAEWQYRDAVPSTDRNATPFDFKPWRLKQGVLRASNYPDPRGDGAQMVFHKPTVYLPVKRRTGVDQHPTLILSIKLTSPNLTTNPKIPIWAGTPVDIEVVNLTASKDGEPEVKLALQGTLDAALSCRIEIPAAKVKSWLDPDSSPLKARVNENLLDFRFTLKGVKEEDGQPVLGQSQNRVFLYCRKTVVFLPGLFASQVQFKTATGEVVGFPDFWNERFRAVTGALGKLAPGAGILASIPDMRFQRADVLECDDKGAPLIPCPKPSLLMLRDLRFLFGHNVIDPFTALHNARVERLPHVPNDFRLYTLIIYPYDWRGDLTDAAAALLKHLDELKNGPTTASLSKAPDTDDQVTVMGHSTGGVVIRRALAPIAASECTGIDPALPGANRPPADTMIRFALFLSVPFSGAPKAAAVLLTGLDAPEGNRQIPFIVPESLVAVSLSMPIVYHLHTSAQYAHRPSTSPTRPSDRGRDNEADKAAFVEDALVAGLMPRPWLVRAEMATAADHRMRLALDSQKWHELIVELADRVNGHVLQHAISQSWGHVRWFEDEVNRRGLAWQKDVRAPSGWNAYLAGRAKAFHSKSVSAVTGVWSQRSAILWGASAHAVTLRQLNLSKVSEKLYPDIMAFLSAKRILVNDIGGTRSVPKVVRHQSGPFVGGSEDVAQWALEPDGKQLKETTWRLAWVQQFAAGDGTVPADSQLAEGGNVRANLLTTDTSAQEAPVHMDSTKSAHVWKTLVAAIHDDKIPAQTGDETTFRETIERTMARSSGAPDLPLHEPVL